MAVALDTNVFVYAHFPEYAEHEKVRLFLERFARSGETFHIGWQVFYEYVRVVTHPKILKAPLTAKEAVEGMQHYLNSTQCRVLTETDSHHDILREVLTYLPSARGNFIHDCHYAALLKEHGVEEIVTTDSDFKKFDFLKVINPVLG